MGLSGDEWLGYLTGSLCADLYREAAEEKKSAIRGSARYDPQTKLTLLGEEEQRTQRIEREARITTGILPTTGLVASAAYMALSGDLIGGGLGIGASEATRTYMVRRIFKKVEKRYAETANEYHQSARHEILTECLNSIRPGPSTN